jgi:hypothetical protein
VNSALVPQKIAEAAAVFNAASSSVTAGAAGAATTATRTLTDLRRGSGTSSPSILREAPPWDVFQNLMQATADSLSQNHSQSQSQKSTTIEQNSVEQHSATNPAKRIKKG